MMTSEELEAELEARLESAVRLRLNRELIEVAEEARDGRMSPLDDVLRRFHLHGLGVASAF